MTTPLKSPLNSSRLEGNYAQQQRQLEEGALTKKQQIEELKKISEHVAAQTQKVHQATLTTQNLFAKFQEESPTQPAVSTDPGDPLKQLENLLSLAREAQKCPSPERLKTKLSALNQQIGQTQALTLILQEEAQDFDRLIQRFEALKLTKTKKVAEAKRLSLNLSKLKEPS